MNKWMWHEPPKDKIQRNIVIDENGCWVWQKSFRKNGYGQIWVEGKYYSTHRVAYEQYVGPIPENHDLDHLCRVIACCNPDHLEPVTRSINVRRGWESGRIHHSTGASVDNLK